jgi:hypothetical protein
VCTYVFARVCLLKCEQKRCGTNCYMACCGIGSSCEVIRQTFASSAQFSDVCLVCPTGNVAICTTLLPLPRKDMHACAHTHTYTHTDTHRHRHTHMYTSNEANTIMCKPNQNYEHFMQTRRHRHAYPHVYVHIQTHTYMHTGMHETHAHVGTMHVAQSLSPHTDNTITTYRQHNRSMCSHTHTHTHTHSHTHTNIYVGARRMPQPLCPTNSGKHMELWT